MKCKIFEKLIIRLQGGTCGLARTFFQKLKCEAQDFCKLK